MTRENVFAKYIFVAYWLRSILCFFFLFYFRPDGMGWERDIFSLSSLDRSMVD